MSVYELLISGELKSATLLREPLLSRTERETFASFRSSFNLTLTMGLVQTAIISSFLIVTMAME
jgi:hypothetical protein